MEYELAKKLKDAGFPQVGGRVCIHGIQYGHCDDEFCIPTLSELINACGDKIKRIERSSDYYGKNLTSWFIWSTEPVSASWELSLEEALAKLWIELNKK